MAAQLHTKRIVLLGNGSMPVSPTPLPYPLEASTQTVTGGLALYNPVPPTTPTPVVGEAEKVQRYSVWFRRALSGDQTPPAESFLGVA